MTAMPPCPFSPKRARGAHELCVIVPDSDTQPMVLFCSRCGMTARHALTLPAPLDDLPADAIARLTRRA